MRSSVWRRRTAPGLAFRIVLVLTIWFAAIAATVGQANAATRVGGPNIEGYCEWKYPARAHDDMPMAQAKLKYHSADGWRCYQVTVESFPTGGWPYAQYEHVLDYSEYRIDMNDVCRQQYGSRAWASASNSSNPYGWFCYV